MTICNHMIAIHSWENGADIGCVMIHGGPGGRSDREFGEKLSKQFWVLMYDQYGGGESDALDDSFEIGPDYYREEARAVIEGNVDRDYYLIGYSWGASVAVEYASHYKDEHLKGLILISPFLSGRLWTRDQLETLGELSPRHQAMMRDEVEKGEVTESSLEAMRILFSKVLFMKEENKADADRYAAIPRGKVCLRLWGRNDAIPIGPLSDYDATHLLKEISVPVMIIYGSSDEVRRESIDEYLALLPKGEAAEIEGAGHYSIREIPETYVECIIDYIRGKS